MGAPDPNDQIKTGESLPELTRSGNLFLSRIIGVALGSSLGCVSLLALWQLTPTINQMVANWREIKLAEIDCVRCNTQLNFCSSDLKVARANLVECRQ